MLKEHPKKSSKDEPNEEKRDEFNMQQDQRVREKLLQFTSAGNPGVKFKKVYDKMLASLELPKHVKDQLGVASTVLPATTVEKPSEDKKVLVLFHC